MAIARWDPWGELAALQRDVNELFRRGFGIPERSRANVPAMDAFRTDTGMCVRMELPGMKPEDVDISVQDRQLVVTAERRAEEKIEEDRWVRRERTYGRLQRAFTLPQGIDADQIKASFENGILQLDIPNPPERQPRRIEISSTESSEGQTVDVTEAAQAQQTQS